MLNASNSIELATVVITLKNGESREVIPAFTSNSVQNRDLTQSTISVDESMLLPTLFCFAKADVFRRKKMKLHDANGVEIPKNLPEGSPEVLVYLDKPETVNLIRFVTTPLNAEIVTVDSVEDAMRRIAISNFVSKPLSKKDWNGLASEFSETLQKIYNFAVEHKLGGTVAQSYFGVRATVSCLQKTAILGEDVFCEGKVRSVEEATTLYNAVAEKFGVRCAKQTRYARAISACVKEADLNTIIANLSTLTATVIQEIKDEPSDTKSVKISKHLLGK